MPSGHQHTAAQLEQLARRIRPEVVRWGVGASVILRAGEADERLTRGGVIAATNRALHYYEHFDSGPGVHETLPLTAIEMHAFGVLRFPDGDADGIRLVASGELCAPWVVAAHDAAQQAFLASKLEATLARPAAAPPPSSARLRVASSAASRAGRRRPLLIAGAVAGALAVGGIAFASTRASDLYQDVACRDFTQQSASARDTVLQGAADEMKIDRAKAPHDAMYEACLGNPEGLIGERMLTLADPPPSLEGTAAAGETPAASETPVVSENAFKPVGTYRWDAEAASGAEATATIELGAVRAQSQPLPDGFENLGSICESDSERDAFLPIRMTVRNTTDGFDLSASLRLTTHNVKDRFQARIGIHAANAFSDGPSCRAMTDGSIDDGFGVGFDSIAPDGENDHNTLLVLENYYTPESPSGDDAGLSEYFAAAHLSEDAGPLETVCFDAPAGRYAFAGGFLRLSGVLSPGIPLGSAPIDRTPPTKNDPKRCGDSDPANLDAESGVPDAPCLEFTRSQDITTTKGPRRATYRTYDRVSSIWLVCTGFGAPEGLKLTTGMQCALLAAAASYAPMPGGETAKIACAAEEVKHALETGNWAGPAKGLGCEFFGTILAGTAAAAVTAGTSPTGPAALVVGAGTYKAFKAGMDLACGGLFEGGALALGEKLEGDHQAHIARRILDEGKCLRETQDPIASSSYSAEDCPQ